MRFLIKVESGNAKLKHKYIDNNAKIWLRRRGVVQTPLEDYRGRDVEAEIQEIQQLLDGADEEEQSC